MNKRKITIAVIVLILIITTAAVAAETHEPGSKEDPVVTKSYVDSQIAALKGGTGATPADAFKAVEVKKGKRLIGGEGAEFILRSGEASAIDNGADGLSDLTGAKDLKGGTPISKNHHIIIPRDDGRGIKADTDLWVMVKGDYVIK